MSYVVFRESEDSRRDMLRYGLVSIQLHPVCVCVSQT